MALERYWDYAYSVSDQGNTRYHGPLDKQAEGGAGVMSSGHHYGILSSGWDDQAYHKGASGYDHISMYDASSDSAGTYYYGGEWKAKNHTKFAGQRKDVIGYDSTYGADATLSRGKDYFTKWLSEADYKDQDTTGRTLTTYGISHRMGKDAKYKEVGGAVEVINFDQYMNDVGYAEAAQAMGIDKYETLDQVHNAMGYMQGTWQPPAEEVVEEEVQSDLQVLDGTESGQGDGYVDAVLGTTEQNQSYTAGNLVNDQSDFNASQGETMSGTQTNFDQMLSDALYGVGGSADNALGSSIVGGLQGAYATQLQNEMSTAQSTYASQLNDALYGVGGTAEDPTGGYLGREQTLTDNFNLTIGALNTSMYGEGGTADNITGGYAGEIRDAQEAAIQAQQALSVQAAYGDPGNLTGASVTGVQSAGEDEEDVLLKTLGATGSFARDGLRISSLNI